MVGDRACRARVDKHAAGDAHAVREKTLATLEREGRVKKQREKMRMVRWKRFSFLKH
jgi:hypothetical protein